MFIIKWVLLRIDRRQHLRQYFFNMLDVDEMGQDISFLQKSDKWNCSDLFILELHFPLVEQQSTLSLESPVVFIHIDEIEIFELILKVTDGLYGILHHHLPVDFVHDHDARVGDRLFICQTFLSQQIVVNFVLLVFVVVVQMFTKFIQQKDKLLLVYCTFQYQSRHGWWSL